MRQYPKFSDFHIESLRDPEDARLYLEIALENYREDRNLAALQLAINDVIEAQGGLTQLADRIKIRRGSLVRALAAKKPRFETMDAVLTGLGYRLAVVAK